MRALRYLLFGITTLISCFLLQSAPAHAQGQSSQSALTVSPAITEDVVSADKPKTVTVRVSNITNFPLPISGTVKNFTPLEQIENSSEKSKYDASQWFVIKDPDFILQPKETRQVSVTITPPAGAEPGGHYATIYFTPLIPSSALTPSTAYLSAQVGTLAFLIVPGHLSEKISLVSFKVPAVSQSRSMNLSLILKNSGNVHISPNAHIVIKNWSGKQVANLDARTGIVLPGTQKTSDVAWRAPSLFGKYTATASTTYGTSNTKLESVAVTFWVIPWGWLLTIIILGGIIAVISVKTHGRWKKAWQILRNKQ
jgi:P pilus assembly chaperone PapD